jgi:hypothetical protein
MNASRLLEVVQLLINVEKRKKVQDALNTINTALSNLVSNPSQASHQSEFAQSVEKLRTLMGEVQDTFQPAQIKLLEEIGAADFFVGDLAGEISRWVSENVATPAVAQQKLTTLIGERDAYLTQVRQLRENLTNLGIEVDGLQAGQAEIGFLLPRELFDNELEPLLKELGVVKQIIRAFSEAAMGSAEPIEVRQISTSDPLFFFGLAPETIALIGAAITWALHSWEKVEKIRKLRAETANIPAFKGGQIEKMFDDTIKQEVEKAVQEHTAEIMKGIKGRKGRENEQETHIKWALESIISRVERGMTVEIRMLPPPKAKVAEGEDPPPPPPVFDDLGRIASQLVFPKMEGEPLLTLPPYDPKPTKRGKQSDNEQ